ncbi:hypothetical protein FSP39_010953 [Pinctada imbricata]|uniref:Retropepsins domain-containing protein n=1 Tax=Pinctada imbricata TaxID=66713 RepID=A0AA88Y8Y9_PINIB|nr:hypothetical protein FSP39_010953 [Pinctada imbricata]
MPESFKCSEAEICLTQSLYLNKVTISIGNRKTHALVDTGASICVADKGFIDQTIYAGKVLKQPEHANIRGVTGNRLRVLGIIEIKFDIGGNTFTHPIHIIEGLGYSLVLGLDFMRAFNVLLDFQSNQMIFPDDHNTTTVSLIQYHNGLARTITNTIIPKRSEADILVRVSNTQNNVEVLLEPHPSLVDFHRMAARCLVRVNESKAIIRVLNPTHSDIKIRAKEIVATVSDVEPTVYLLRSDSDINMNNIPSQEHETNTPNLDFDFSNSELTDEHKSRFRDFSGYFTLGPGSGKIGKNRGVLMKLGIFNSLI